MNMIGSARLGGLAKAARDAPRAPRDPAITRNGCTKGNAYLAFRNAVVDEQGQSFLGQRP